LLTRELRALLWLFAVLALFAGLLLFVLSDNTDATFSWTIKPALTAAFLGASYWAAFVLLAWSARQTAWPLARPAILPVLVIAVLLLAATLIHRDRFHTDTVFGWFWIIVYAVIPLVMLVLLSRQRRARSQEQPPTSPLPAVLRVALALEGLALASIGIALFVSPDSADSLWPWNLTPLTARAVGAFLVGFGAAALQAARLNDLPRLRGSALAYAFLGLLQLIAVARYPSELDGSGVRGVAYVVLAVVVLATGLAGSALPAAAPRASA
jgi:peptidoglycan/LPS O-acetylase OafA/YrhL